MHNVYFKDESTHNFPLVAKDIGRRKRANEQVDRYTVPYRNGELVIHSGKYDSYERPMLFTLTNLETLSDIYEWLEGYGELRTDMDEGGYFNASVLGEINLTPDGPVLNELAVNFLVEPFFYLDSGNELIELTGLTELQNEGNVESEPVITVYGVGDVDLTVNSQSVLLRGIEESITMDTKLSMCYKSNTNQGRKMKGDYIRLEKGNNTISWNGNVTKVEIIPRWCER